MEMSQLAKDIVVLLHQAGDREVTMKDIKEGLQSTAVPSHLLYKTLAELKEAKVIVHYALKHNEYAYRLAIFPVPPHLKYRIKR